MKRSIPFFGAVVLVACILVPVDSTARAGRVGGPASTVSMAPAGMSVYFDVGFVAGEPATVTLVGDGGSMLHVMIYDTDGHVAIGNGSWDRKSVTMNVYRTGMFRIEVRNIGIRDDTFTLSTN